MIIGLPEEKRGAKHKSETNPLYIDRQRTVNVMSEFDDGQRQGILGLYAHLSRMYNSSVNAGIAVVFGWLAFNGVAFNLVPKSTTFL